MEEQAAFNRLAEGSSPSTCIWPYSQEVYDIGFPIQRR